MTTVFALVCAGTVIAFILFWHLIGYFRDAAVVNHTMRLNKNYQDEMLKNMFADEADDDIEALLKVVQ